MLNVNSVNEAVELARILESQGYCVDAVNGTPVAALVSANCTGDLVHQVNLNAAESQVEMIGQLALVSSRTVGRDNTPEHDLAQYDLVEKASGVVAVNLDMAKNIVVPQVISVLQDVVNRAELTAIRDLNNILVVPDHPADIWTNAAVLEICDKYRDVPPSDIHLVDLVELPTAEVATGWLATGSTNIDTDVVALLAANPDLALNAVNGIFANVDGNLSFADAINPYRADRDRIMAVFLIARHLLNNIPENGKVSLGDLRSRLTDIMVEAAASVCRVVALQERAVANNTLLRSFPTTEIGNGKEIIIHVNGAVYNRWIATGGSPEIILGSFVSDREVDPAKLLEEGARYTKSWANYTKTRANVVAEGRFNRTLIELRRVMVAEIDKVYEGRGLARSTMDAVLDRELAKFNLQSLDNFPAFVRDVVCNVLFGHTNAINLLSEMDRVKVSNPEYSMDECATEAVAELMADWIDNQLVASKLTLA